MEVIVDGLRNFELKGNPADMLAVVGAVSEFLRGQHRGILSVTVDGESVAPEDLIKKLKDKPTESAQRIEISSEDVAAMAARCLAELEAALPELPKACLDLARIFQGESPADGFDPFNELARIWGTVKERELLIANSLEVPLAEFKVRGVSIEKMHEELNGFLEEAAEALKSGDTVLLGDLLEYELAPRAELEAEIVQLLRERSAAASS